MLVKEFRTEIEKAYNKYFDGSMVTVSIFKCLGSRLYIECYLAGEKSEYINGYKENDMMKNKFYISLSDNFNGDTDELPESMTLINQAKSYLTKPSSSYMVYSSNQMSYRKTVGDSGKIIKTLEAYFKKLHDSIAEAKASDRIHSHHIELVNRRVR